MFRTIYILLSNILANLIETRPWVYSWWENSKRSRIATNRPPYDLWYQKRLKNHSNRALGARIGAHIHSPASHLDADLNSSSFLWKFYDKDLSNGFTQWVFTESITWYYHSLSDHRQNALMAWREHYHSPPLLLSGLISLTAFSCTMEKNRLVNGLNIKEGI